MWQFLLTHHLVKLKDKKERTDVYLGDLYGSQFIAAGTSDAWGLHLDASQDVPDKPMVLKCLKAWTGITEAGDRYLLERNSEDLSLNIQQYNGLNDGIEGLKKTERRVWDNCWRWPPGWKMRCQSSASATRRA